MLGAQKFILEGTFVPQMESIRVDEQNTCEIQNLLSKKKKKKKKRRRKYRKKQTKNAHIYIYLHYDMIINTVVCLIFILQNSSHETSDCGSLTIFVFCRTFTATFFTAHDLLI